MKIRRIVDHLCHCVDDSTLNETVDNRRIGQAVNHDTHVADGA